MNPWRLALGTLTVLPVRPPEGLDRRVAGGAMVLAPLVGTLVGLVVAVPLWLLEQTTDLSPWVLAVLAVSLLAVLTRAIHLDGLADTADGLGSGRRGASALAVMRRSDIGPFGTVTLLLVLLLQVCLLAQALAGGYGVLLVALAVVAGRATLPLACTRWFPAARGDGLGAAVAGSVGVGAVGAAGVVTGLALVGVGGIGLVVDVDVGTVVRCVPAVLVGPVAGVLLTARAAHRFGGVTGDVLGAAVEVSTTAALLAGVLVAG